RCFGDQASVVHDGDPVTDPFQLVYEMARDKNCRAAFGHVREERAEDVPPHHGIESIGRLVQHEPIPALRQGEQSHELRLLAFGETAAAMLAVELEALDELLRPC